mmetsp:Transcript_43560/g.170523  ORF Transcript_43560/g.170523 Transcript_43560/m.170523 type:complete len:137 (+) Transcript_43560:434-844(+)
MTEHIISVDASATVGESMKIMASHNIRWDFTMTPFRSIQQQAEPKFLSSRHLPVLEHNQLVGVVSMRELVKKVTICKNARSAGMSLLNDGTTNINSSWLPPYQVAEYHEKHISYLMAQIQRMAVAVSHGPVGKQSS